MRILIIFIFASFPPYLNGQEMSVNKIPEGCIVHPEIVGHIISSSIKQALREALALEHSKSTGSSFSDNNERVKRQSITKQQDSIAISGDFGHSIAEATSNMRNSPGLASSNAFAKSGFGGKSEATGSSSSSMMLRIRKKRQEISPCPIPFQLEVERAIEESVMATLLKFVQ